MLNSSQKKALSSIQAFLIDDSQTSFCLDAPSGFGKTALLNNVIENYKDFLLKLSTATTNKAASNMTEAQTIHRLIGLKPMYRGGLSTRNASLVAPSIILIDEASYITEELYNHINTYCKGSKIIYVGDRYQLKGVNSTFSIFEKGYPTATLDIPMRQDPDSPLYALCKYLRQCVIDQVLPQWELFLNQDGIIFHDDTSYVAAVRDHFKRDDDAARIIAYENAVVDGYNQAVMDIQGKQDMYAIGTKLISRKYVPKLLFSEQPIVVNTVHYDVTPQGLPVLTVNGLYMVPLGDWYAKALKKAADEKEWGTLYTLQEAYCEFSLGYALTTYKAQGSTYDAVFLDVRNIISGYALDTILRQLYVGVSRARKEVHLYGTPLA